MNLGRGQKKTNQENSDVLNITLRVTKKELEKDKVQILVENQVVACITAEVEVIETGIPTLPYMVNLKSNNAPLGFVMAHVVETRDEDKKKK